MKVFFIFFTLYTVTESAIQKDLFRRAIELTYSEYGLTVKKKNTVADQSFFVTYYRTYFLYFSN